MGLAAKAMPPCSCPTWIKSAEPCWHFQLSDSCTVCQGCGQPRNRCRMLQVHGVTHLWSRHDRMFSLLHGVFAELGITRILTVILSQCYFCCLLESSLTLKQEFPASPSCLPTCGVSITLLSLEQKDYSTAKENMPIGTLKTERL